MQEAAMDPLVLSPQPEASTTKPELGPATVVISEPSMAEAIPQTPQTSLTFLLVSGRRKTMAFEPETAVGRVKELVWNAWPSGGCSFVRLSSYPLAAIYSY